MSRKIKVDKLKTNLDNYGVMETTLKWEVEHKVWVLDIMSLTLLVQHSMLRHYLITSTSIRPSHSMGRRWMVQPWNHGYTR